MFSKIYEKFNLDPMQIIIPKYGSRPEFNVSQIIEALYLYGGSANKHLGILGKPTFIKYVKQIFPNVKLKGITWPSWILSHSCIKKCPTCSEIKPFEEFYVDKSTSSGFSSSCKSCTKDINHGYYYNNVERYRSYSAKRRAAEIKAIPGWADLEAIKQFYINCPKGHEVDHIIPLQGKTVSGLHVIDNLQYLTIEENRSKSNKLLAASEN